jgi:putative ABC transport system permease protein
VISVRLAAPLIRAHRWTYVGLALVLTAASFLVGASMLMYAAASEADISTAGQTRNAAAIRLLLAGSARFATSFLVALGLFVAVLLVFQTSAGVVDARRRELALLRLSGATAAQVTRIIVVEAFLLGLSTGVVGAALAPIAVVPYRRLLEASNNWPPGVPVHIHVGQLVWCIALITAVAVVGALHSAVRIGRTPPVAAVSAQDSTPARHEIGRWITIGTGVALIIVSLLLPAERVNYQVSTAAVGAGAVLVATALARFVVQAVAQSLGRVLSAITPAAGLLARRQIVFRARGTAALATPLLLVLGLGAVFGTMAQTARADGAAAFDRIRSADAVVQQSSGTHPDREYRAARKLPSVSTATRVQRSDAWSWAEADVPRDEPLDLIGIDPETFRRYVPLTVEQGDFGAVHGTDVAAVSGAGRLGSRIRLASPTGEHTTGRIVAIVTPSAIVNGTFLVDGSAFRLDRDPSIDTWFASRASGSSAAHLRADLRAVVGSGAVLTRNEWVHMQIDHAVDSQRTAILTLVGGAAMLAVVSLVQGGVFTARDRSAEYALQRRVGGSRRTILASVAIEMFLMVVTVGLLATATTALVVARMQSALHSLDVPVEPVVPVVLLTNVLLGGAAAAVAAALTGTLIALRRPARLL